MKYNKEKAKKIIEEYSLSKGILAVWKYRCKIPEYYFEENIKTDLDAKNKLLLARIIDALETPAFMKTKFAKICNFRNTIFQDYSRNKQKFYIEDVEIMQVEILKIRSEIRNFLNQNEKIIVEKDYIKQVDSWLESRTYLQRSKLFSNRNYYERHLKRLKNKNKTFEIVEFIDLFEHLQTVVLKLTI